MRIANLRCIRPAEVCLKPLCHRLESCVPAEKSSEMFQQAVDRAPVDLEIFLTRILRSPAIAVSFLESRLETIFFLAGISNNTRLFDGRSALSPLPRSMSSRIPSPKMTYGTLCKLRNSNEIRDGLTLRKAEVFRQMKLPRVFAYLRLG